MYNYRYVGVFQVLFILVLLTITPGSYADVEYHVGDRVVLVTRDNDIPAHPESGDRSIPFRFESGLVVSVRAISAIGWFLVEDENGREGWIVKSYIERFLDAATPEEEGVFVVGTWNIEHFGSGGRGFPEYLPSTGGPKYDYHTDDDIDLIARRIRDGLNVKILVLNEINDDERVYVEGDAPISPINNLVEKLGSGYEYIITESGGTQHIAILYDTDDVLLNAYMEVEVSYQEIKQRDSQAKGDDIFARDPLIAHFTLLRDGVEMNDLLVVGLHLASGQDNQKNHDAAMALLMEIINDARAEGTVLPQDEYDIFVAGDLNLDIYKAPHEEFVGIWEASGYDMLAEPGYPYTRLKGNPLQPGSRLDYIIVSCYNDEHSGLQGQEVNTSMASVRSDIVDNADYGNFRLHYSDHFPVTIPIRVMDDLD